MTDQEKEFYDKKFYFSYSSLNKLIYDPKLFYSYYVLNEREERTDAHLIDGRVIHCLLLQPELFDEQFIVNPGKTPTPNTKKLVDTIYKMKTESDDINDYHDQILGYLIVANLHQSLKTDEQRLEKILTDDATEYWNYLCSSSGKTVIDTECHERCKNAVEMFTTNPAISEIFDSSKLEEYKIEVYNELELQYDLNDKPFGLKGIIDRLLVNSEAGLAKIFDIKTTGKTLSEFTESIEFYSYWLQASIYISLVYKFLQDKHPDKSFNVNFSFVVYDKLKNTCIFEVSRATEGEWHRKMLEIVDRAEYHYKSNDFTRPFDFRSGIKVI